MLAKQTATEEFAKIRDQFCRERIIQGSFLMCVCFCNVVGHSVKDKVTLAIKAHENALLKGEKAFTFPLCTNI